MRATVHLWACLVCVVLAQPGQAQQALVLPAQPSAALRLGAQQLENALHGAGLQPHRVAAADVDALPAGAVVVGRHNRWLPPTHLPDDLDADGFVVHGDGDRVYAAGGSARADAYALAWLAERVRLDPQGWRTTTVRREPNFEIRIASGCTPEQALLLGYNAWGNAPGVSRVVSFAGFKPTDRASDAARILRNQLERAGQLGLEVVAVGDEFELPALLAQREGAQITEIGGDGELCAAAPRLWELHRAKYRALAEQYPQLGYCAVRLGENYASLSGGAYIGSGVASNKDEPAYCERCAHLSYAERTAKVIRVALAGLGDADVRYVQRTWDTHDDRMHSDPDVLRAVLALIPERQRVLWSVKYTKTDFWRYNFPNPTIGVGGVPQLVEFQCQREYEGKGAFPNWIGEEAAAGHRLAAAKECVGVWHAHHGGGWGGPHVVDDLWNEANIWTLAKLAWEPGATPMKLAHDWAALTFGAVAAPAFAELLQLSDDAVLKLRYFAEYCREHSGWAPAHNWIRDDKIRGESRIEEIYDNACQRVEPILAEKAEALALIAQMRNLATEAAPTIDPAARRPSWREPRARTGVWTPTRRGTCRVRLRIAGDEIELGATTDVGEAAGNLRHRLARVLSTEDGDVDVAIEAPRVARRQRAHTLRIAVRGGTLQPGPMALVFAWPDGQRDVCAVAETALDASLAQRVLTSLEYEFALAETCHHYVAAYMLYRRWLDRGDDQDQTAAAAHGAAWARAWHRYRFEIPKLPDCPTLFTDDGMEATMAIVRRATLER
ncbi:MAG: hypothetical protein AAF628_14085 [Planctomycetota bacterium]